MKKELSDYKMPIRISSNVKFIKYVDLIIIVFVSFYLIEYLINNEVSLFNLIIALAFILVCAYYLKLIYSLATIKFDSEHFYVTIKNETKQLKLKDIKSIKMLPDEINKKNIWKIEYLEFGKLSSIKILQRGWTLKYINLFQKAALEHNKRINIKNYTYTFDSDV